MPAAKLASWQITKPCDPQAPQKSHRPRRKGGGRPAGRGRCQWREAQNAVDAAIATSFCLGPALSR